MNNPIFSVGLNSNSFLHRHSNLHDDTNKEFTLPKSERVKLSLYNIKEQLVRELFDDNKQAGSYSLDWDGKDRSGKDVPIGIYLAKISYGNKSFAKKIPGLHCRSRKKSFQSSSTGGIVVTNLHVCTSLKQVR